MSQQVLVVLLGLLSSGAMLIGALSVHRTRLLLFGVLAGCIVLTEYLLLGAWAGVLAIGIGLVWTVYAVLGQRYRFFAHPYWVPIFLGLQVVAFLHTTDVTTATPLAYVPLLGGLGGVIGVYLKNVLHMKAIFIICGTGWLAYEGMTGLYGQMLGEGANLIANAVAFSALLSAQLRGIPQAAMQNLDTQLIGTITGAIHLPTRPLPLIDMGRYPMATQQSKQKPKRGAHPGSVGYARLNAEYDRARREMHEAVLRRFEQETPGRKQ